MSTFWSWWVIILFVGTVIGVCWVLIANRKVVLRDDQEVEDGTPKTGHVYDGIEEYDNPLPAWWFKMFIGSVVFSFVYVVLYPGLGNFPGLLGWTSISQWQQQEARADERFEAVYAKFEGQSIEELAANPAAFKIGRRLFGNNCAVCHGSDGGGAYGFPDLTDDDWLYGNTPQAIETSIRHGRRGVMPGWGAALGEAGVSEVTEYLFKLGGRDHDEALATAGEQKFAGFCAGCHGADASGNVALGAPDLSDDIWLYGGSPEMIKTSIRSGRQGNMPAQDKMLRTSKIRLLTSYVYGLSER
ncbi:MAG TPA: cytochrome-c oxidase, cbb3-type subunit III [Porticoccaceae bacterium]|nr:cytochrome-c oxidase, cbb3-type subunit III [Porticoccaceae bacterium]HCO61264.1 cytochrome-c oxidase, cbb3-type subunit III [Porticoccaceae bacterium]